MDIQQAAQKFYDYSNYIRGYSKETIRRYRQAINYYCAFSSHKTLEQITNTSIRKMFFHGRMDRKWKPASFISYQKSLSVFFKWCIDQKYITENPIKDLESPKLDRHLPYSLTKQDAYQLLEAVYNYPYDNDFIRYRNHAIFSTLILAGLRKQEILKLRFTDVDLLNRTIFIHNSKGNKDRIIPISNTLAISLGRYLELRSKLKITCVPFFVSSLQDRGIADITIKRMVEKFRNSTHIPFSTHKLRHTFATLMVEGGCDIYSLSRMMGHEDIKTTTIYLSASAEHLRAQIFKHPLN